MSPVPVVRGMFRYGVLSVASFVATLGITALLHEFAGRSEELSYGVALVVVFVGNFLAMRYYVCDGAGGSAARQLGMFLASSLAFRGMEYAAFLIAHTWLGAPYAAAIVAIQLTSSLAKFFFYRGAVFTSPACAPPR